LDKGIYIFSDIVTGNMFLIVGVLIIISLDNFLYYKGIVLSVKESAWL